MAAKRVNVLWAILGVVGGMALGAWYMGSRIQSPAEMAARTAAPEPSAILVPVESRVLALPGDSRTERCLLPAIRTPLSPPFPSLLLQ